MFWRNGMTFLSNSKVHMKILLGDVYAKEEHENILKSTISKESLYPESNDIGFSRSM